MAHLTAPARSAALIQSPPMTIEPDWIDYNGHLNMAYYNVLFDRMLDLAFEQLDISAAYVAREKKSLFTVEAHICYLNELTVDNQVVLTLQFVDCDSKRLQVFQEMWRAGSDVLAATSESLLLHVDMESRRTTPFGEAAQQRIAAAVDAHRGLPMPERSGRKIEIKRG